MQIRATIIIKREVQRVGYRDAVERIARKGNIKGFVENLKPYDVRIVCEGEQGDIKRFIGALKIEEDPLISISDVAAEYEKPTGEFEYFEIKRGSSEEETAERLDLAALHLKNLTSAVSIMNKNIGGKIDNLDEHLAGKIDGLDEHLAGKIDGLDEHLAGKIDGLGGHLAGKIDGLGGHLAGKIDGLSVHLAGKIDGLGVHLAGKIDDLGGKFDAGRVENKEGFAMLGAKIDAIKADTSTMTEKQDRTIEILEDVREDTGEITNTLAFLKDIYRETLELRDKYEVLSKDVEAIKVKLKAG